MIHFYFELTVCKRRTLIFIVFKYLVFYVHSNMVLNNMERNLGKLNLEAVQKGAKTTLKSKKKSLSQLYIKKSASRLVNALEGIRLGKLQVDMSK